MSSSIPYSDKYFILCVKIMQLCQLVTAQIFLGICLPAGGSPKDKPLAVAKATGQRGQEDSQGHRAVHCPRTCRQMAVRAKPSERCPAPLSVSLQGSHSRQLRGHRTVTLTAMSSPFFPYSKECRFIPGSS